MKSPICSKMLFILAGMIALATGTVHAEQVVNEDFRTVTITSSLDGTGQKSLFYVPAEATPDKKGDLVPLMVMLHTWSGDYTQNKA